MSEKSAKAARLSQTKEAKTSATPNREKYEAMLAQAQQNLVTMQANVQRLVGAISALKELEDEQDKDTTPAGDS